MRPYVVFKDLKVGEKFFFAHALTGEARTAFDDGTPRPPNRKTSTRLYEYAGTGVRFTSGALTRVHVVTS